MIEWLAFGVMRWMTLGASMCQFVLFLSSPVHIWVTSTSSLGLLLGYSSSERNIHIRIDHICLLHHSGLPTFGKFFRWWYSTIAESLFSRDCTTIAACIRQTVSSPFLVLFPISVINTYLFMFFFPIRKLSTAATVSTQEGLHMLTPPTFTNHQSRNANATNDVRLYMGDQHQNATPIRVIKLVRIIRTLRIFKTVLWLKNIQTCPKELQRMELTWMNFA
jgi:hypothetical protein